MAAPTTQLKVVFGAMTLGKAGAEQARVHDLADCAAILDVFQAHGHNEIDTARTYGGGSSEAYLGQLDLAKRGIVLDTKLSPGRGQRGAGKGTGTTTAGAGATSTAHTYTHKPADLKPALLESLAALNTDKVDMWYLHAPDRNTPYEDTLREVNSLHQQGYFRRFGISNYSAWEVAQISEIAIREGWKRPDVYQGVYNALHRTAEPELFPCLRHYGIAFYEYNPVAGGMLTDRYQRDPREGEVVPGSRFDPARNQGANYRQRYWNDAYFDALDVVRPVAKQHGISTAEAALRWVNHHSVLRREHGDAVIIGASSAAQLEENLVSLEKGPLPEAVVQAFDDAWEVAKPVCTASSVASDQFVVLTPEGPFATAADYFAAFAEQHLALIADGQLYTDYPVDTGHLPVDDAGDAVVRVDQDVVSLVIDVLEKEGFCRCCPSETLRLVFEEAVHQIGVLKGAAFGPSLVTADMSALCDALGDSGTSVARARAEHTTDERVGRFFWGLAHEPEWDDALPLANALLQVFGVDQDRAQRRETALTNYAADERL